MKKLKDIRIITKEEGAILFEALHKYLFGKDGFIHKGAKEELVEINQLYQDFKWWMNEEEV